MRRAVTLALSLFLLACGASASSTNAPRVRVGGERFELDLDRVAVVGQRMHFASTTTQREHAVTTFRGQAFQTSDATTVSSCTAVVDVRAVDANGLASELRFQIQSCTMTEDGVPLDLARPGQVLVVQRAATPEAAVLRLDGAPISEELATRLADVIPVTFEDDDATVFSVTESHAVGERWPVDVAPMLRDLASSSPLRLDPSHVRGEAQLVSRREIDGVDGLELAVTFEAEHLRIDGLAQGGSLRDGRMTFGAGGFYPLDPALPQIESSFDMHADLSLVMSTPQGNAEVALTMERSERRSMRPF